eukprot:4571998-Karenia_brevis.AAC.1
MWREACCTHVRAGALDVNEKIQTAFLSMIGKPTKEFVHVDMAAKMTELGLTTLVPDEVWPPAMAVRELAT